LVTVLVGWWQSSNAYWFNLPAVEDGDTFGSLFVFYILHGSLALTVRRPYEYRRVFCKPNHATNVGEN
jgi:hypothetical protein